MILVGCNGGCEGVLGGCYAVALLYGLQGVCWGVLVGCYVVHRVFWVFVAKEFWLVSMVLWLVARWLFGCFRWLLDCFYDVPGGCNGVLVGCKVVIRRFWETVCSGWLLDR